MGHVVHELIIYEAKNVNLETVSGLVLGAQGHLVRYFEVTWGRVHLCLCFFLKHKGWGGVLQLSLCSRITGLRPIHPCLSLCHSQLWAFLFALALKMESSNIFSLATKILESCTKVPGQGSRVRKEEWLSFKEEGESLGRQYLSWE